MSKAINYTPFNDNTSTYSWSYNILLAICFTIIFSACEDTQKVTLKVHNNSIHKIDSFAIDNFIFPKENYSVEIGETRVFHIDCKQIPRKDTSFRISFKMNDKKKQLAFGKIIYRVPRKQLYMLEVNNDKVLLRSNR